MKTIRIHLALLGIVPALAGICSMAGAEPVAVAPNDGLAWKREADSLALLRKGQVIWQFNFGTNEGKPFFHPLALPGGPALTWNHPPDHYWHHALWFSWKYINGVNYWEEDPKTGHAAGLTAWRDAQLETRPDFSARIVMDLGYLPAGGDGTPVMSEHRVIEVSPPDQQGAYHLDWTLTFTAAEQDVLLDRTPLPGEPGGQSWGGYAGLSVRFAHALGEMQAFGTGGAVEFTNGAYRGRATAMDYSGIIEKRPAGICILDHPDNLNAPSPWYVISNSTMSYFSPAILTYQPHVLKARQSLSLRYRVVVHEGRWNAKQLRLAVEQYTGRRQSGSEHER